MSSTINKVIIIVIIIIIIIIIIMLFYMCAIYTVIIVHINATEMLAKLSRYFQIFD